MQVKSLFIIEGNIFLLTINFGTSSIDNSCRYILNRRMTTQLQEIKTAAYLSPNKNMKDNAKHLNHFKIKWPRIKFR